MLRPNNADRKEKGFRLFTEKKGPGPEGGILRNKTRKGNRGEGQGSFLRSWPLAGVLEEHRG